MAGRNLPWWLAGTSIVATTFAADTPLAIAGLVVTEGIAGNWFWWADVFPAMIAALLIAQLWRRSGVLTDNEIVELRYSGSGAAGLRAFRAVYFGVIRNAIVLGWVNLAMLKVLELTPPPPNKSAPGGINASTGNRYCPSLTLWSPRSVFSAVRKPLTTQRRVALGDRALVAIAAHAEVRAVLRSISKLDVLINNAGTPNDTL